MVTAEEKEAVRKKLLETLLSLTSREVERRSKNVEKNLQKLSYYINTKCIMVYFPLKGEVNLLGMVREALKEKIVCFPFIKGKELIPYQIQDLENDLVTGPFGVKQPTPERTKPVSKEDLGMVIIPGLAFDREHYRLGRGGGYYDRFLRSLGKKTKKIGVAFDFQVLETLPHHSSQDEKVDIIVTDTFSI